MLLQFHKFILIWWEKSRASLWRDFLLGLSKGIQKSFFFLLKSGKHLLHPFSRKCISSSCCLSPQKEHSWALCSGHTYSVFNSSWCGVASCGTDRFLQHHCAPGSPSCLPGILHCQNPPRFPSAGVFGMTLAVISNELNSVSFEAGAHGVSISVLNSHLWSALQFCESCWHSAKGSVLNEGSLLLGLWLCCLHLPALALFSTLAAPRNAATRQTSLRAIRDAGWGLSEQWPWTWTLNVCTHTSWLLHLSFLISLMAFTHW